MHSPKLRTLISFGRVAGFFRRLKGDRRGNYSVLVAMLLPVLTGFVGMGTEAGLWLYDQQLEQAATDAAAYSAAVSYGSQLPSGGGAAPSTAVATAETQALAIATTYGYGGTAGCTTSGSSCLQPANCNIASPPTGTTCIEVNMPPLSGGNTNSTCTGTNGIPCAFEVIVAQTPQQLFSKVLMTIYGGSPVTIRARSVGVVNLSPHTTTNTTTTTTTNASNCGGSSCVCVMVTDESSTETTLNISGGTFSLNGCSLEVHGRSATATNLTGTTTAINVAAGTTDTDAPDIYLASTGSPEYTENLDSCGAAQQMNSGCNNVFGTLASLGSNTADPYLSQDASSLPSSTTISANCSKKTPTYMAGAITPGYYLSISISLTTNLPAGTYYVCPGGSFSVSNASTTPVYAYTAPWGAPSSSGQPPSLPTGCTSPPYGANCWSSGDGVTIVLLGTTADNCANLSISGNSVLDLAPPSSGAFSGIAITSSQVCGGSSATSLPVANFSGTAASNLNGAIDLGGYAFTYSGNATTGTGCTQLIAYTLNVTGSTSLGSNCSSAGTSYFGPQQTTTTTSTQTTTTTTYTYSAGLGN
jgi:Flp pilus assembly protein TadG